MASSDPFAFHSRASRLGWSVLAAVMFVLVVLARTGLGGWTSIVAALVLQAGLILLVVFRLIRSRRTAGGELVDTAAPEVQPVSTHGPFVERRRWAPTSALGRNRLALVAMAAMVGLIALLSLTLPAPQFTDPVCGPATQPDIERCVTVGTVPVPTSSQTVLIAASVVFLLAGGVAIATWRGAHPVDEAWDAPAELYWFRRTERVRLRVGLVVFAMAPLFAGVTHQASTTAGWIPTEITCDTAATGVQLCSSGIVEVERTTVEATGFAGLLQTVGVVGGLAAIGWWAYAASLDVRGRRRTPGESTTVKQVIAP